LAWWSRDLPTNVLSNELKVSENALVDWFNFIRDVLCVWNKDNPVTLGGFDLESGNSRVVEIDET
jgi:hypothetical protein